MPGGNCANHKQAASLQRGQGLSICEALPLSEKKKSSIQFKRVWTVRQALV